MKAIDPSTGAVIRDYPEVTPQDASGILEQVHGAQQGWALRSFTDREVPLRRAAALLRKREETLAQLMTSEMGKPIAQSRAEVEKCAWVCEYYADHAASFLAEEAAQTSARRAFVTYRPLGVIFAIMPWNFPYWQVFRFAAPALMAGNGVVLKHAPNVPGCSLAIEEVLRDAGYPEDLFRSVLLHHDHAKVLIEHPLVRGVTFTGSTRAGRIVAAQAGAALKKTVLELGGSDPYVILADADLEAAAVACVAGRLLNSGQSCIAAKRFIVPEPIRGEFERLVLEEMGRRRVGDPRDEETDVGPLARDDLRMSLHAQVTGSVAAGALLALGGELPAGPGFFYPVTVVSGSAPQAPAWREEVFGPVAVVIPAVDEEDALRIANDTSYGLGAAVFTSDIERGERLARDTLEAGACFVNDFVRSDPRLPFGGIKDSGWGRELGRHGILEWVNAKAVWVA